MGEIVRLKTSDGVTINAYRAAPAGKPRGGVVVIQEVFGLNRWVRRIVDDYAREGYLAIAPAMFDRVEPGYETEDYEGARARIGELLRHFTPDNGLRDVAAAVDAVRIAGKVGITGFCFGGMISWRAAHAGLGLSAASGYYGGGVPNYIDLAPSIPIEMHFGDKDTGIPLEQVEALRARYPDVPVYLYDAGHAFANSDRPDKYDARSAAKAWERTLAFFAAHLG